ncbi:hypothetical protein Avbf_12791, partial [Armadillidium vulgare]
MISTYILKKIGHVNTIAIGFCVYVVRLLGRGAGSLIGGFLIDRLGIFNAFRIIAALGGCSGIVYFIINFLFFRKNRQLRDEAVLQEKELRKAKEVEANKQRVELFEIVDSKKEILKDILVWY